MEDATVIAAILSLAGVFFTALLVYVGNRRVGKPNGSGNLATMIEKGLIEIGILKRGQADLVEQLSEAGQRNYVAIKELAADNDMKHAELHDHVKRIDKRIDAIVAPVPERESR